MGERSENFIKLNLYNNELVQFSLCFKVYNRWAYGLGLLNRFKDFLNELDKTFKKSDMKNLSFFDVLRKMADIDKKSSSSNKNTKIDKFYKFREENCLDDITLINPNIGWYDIVHHYQSVQEHGGLLIELNYNIDSMEFINSYYTSYKYYEEPAWYYNSDDMTEEENKKTKKQMSFITNRMFIEPLDWLFEEYLPDLKYESNKRIGEEGFDYKTDLKRNIKKYSNKFYSLIRLLEKKYKCKYEVDRFVEKNKRTSLMSFSKKKKCILCGEIPDTIISHNLYCSLTFDKSKYATKDDNSNKELLEENIIDESYDYQLWDSPYLCICNKCLKKLF